MKQSKSILIVLSVLVVVLLGLGGWYLLSDRQPPEWPVRRIGAALS